MRVGRVGSIIVPIDVIALARHSARTRRTSANFPICHVCGRMVDAVEMVEQNGHSFTILARCHGKEDALRVNFGGSYDDEDMGMAWRSLTFFHPEIGR